MLDAYNWLTQNWTIIAPFLALILPFFAKIPFLAHSTAVEIILKLFMKLLPITPTNSDQSAKEVAESGNPKI